MAARDMGAALRKASSPSRSRVPVYRSEALSSMEAARRGTGFAGRNRRIRLISIAFSSESLPET
jgi:hypothetical protein